MDYQADGPAVLVVEDDSSVLHLLERMLSNGGFTAFTAAKAEDGLSLVRERQGGFDLAIIDMVMPGTSGLDLATDLDREFPDLKVLYISGYVDSIAAEVLARCTPDRVLLKPFSEQTLIERVRALVEPPPRCESPQADETGGNTARRFTVG